MRPSRRSTSPRVTGRPSKSRTVPRRFAELDGQPPEVGRGDEGAQRNEDRGRIGGMTDRAGDDGPRRLLLVVDEGAVRLGGEGEGAPHAARHVGRLVADDEQGRGV